MEKVYLEKRFYPKQPIWTVSLVSGFFTGSVIMIVCELFLSSIFGNWIYNLMFPFIFICTVFYSCYIPARLNSDLSHIKVNDEGVEFSYVNLKLQTITKFFKWDEIKIFEMYERRGRNSLKGIMPQLYLGVDKEMQYKLPNQPFQTLTDRESFFYETKDFIKRYHPEIKVIISNLWKQKIL